MLATAVRIDAVPKRNVGTVVGSDNAARGIGEKLGRLPALFRRGLQLVIELLPIVLAAHPLEPIRGRNLRTSADNMRRRWLGGRHKRKPGRKMAADERRCTRMAALIV